MRVTSATVANFLGLPWSRGALCAAFFTAERGLCCFPRLRREGAWIPPADKPAARALRPSAVPSALLLLRPRSAQPKAASTLAPLSRDASDPEAADHGREHALTRSCRTIACHMCWRVTRGDSSKVRACPKYAHKLNNTCHDGAPGDGFAPNPADSGRVGKCWTAQSCPKSAKTNDVDHMAKC